MKLKQIETVLQKTISDSLEKNLPEMVGKQVDEKIDGKLLTLEEKIETIMKQVDLSGIDTEAKFPLGISKEGKDAITRKAKIAKFLKGVYLKDEKALAELGVKKGLVEGVDSQGGWLVPEEFHNEVDRIRKDVGVIRTLARIFPMKRDVLNVPVLGNSVTVEWVGETQKATNSSPTFKNVKLVAKKAMGTSLISNELLEDADVDVVDFLMEIFAEALAEAEDSQAINGVGVPFTGILNSSLVNDVNAAAGHTTVATMTLKDFRSAQSPLAANIQGGAVWLMSPSVWATIQGMQENSQSVVNFTNNSSILSSETPEGMLKPVGFLWNRPVYLSDQMPAVADITADEPVAIYGNFKYFYMGDRKQMDMKVSDEASVTVGGTLISAFETDQSVIRLTERVAMAVGIGQAFTVLSTAAA